MKELTSVMQDGMVMLQMLVTLLVFFTRWNIGSSTVAILIGRVLYDDHGIEEAVLMQLGYPLDRLLHLKSHVIRCR
jgi:hypothetical protein